MRIVLSIIFSLAFLWSPLKADQAIEAELDAYWAMVSKSVAEGDFATYSSAYHPDAVLVNTNTSYSITKALAGWKQGFDDTAAGKMIAGVNFRFSSRLNDASTVHDTGIFNYYTIDKDGNRSDYYGHMMSLMVKKDGQWLMLMEHQSGTATVEDWNALKD